MAILWVLWHKDAAVSHNLINQIIHVHVLYCPFKKSNLHKCIFLIWFEDIIRYTRMQCGLYLIFISVELIMFTIVLNPLLRVVSDHLFWNCHLQYAFHTLKQPWLKNVNFVWFPNFSKIIWTLYFLILCYWISTVSSVTFLNKRCNNITLPL